MNQPRVSVCIVTYNHENYIEQALVSALTQRTKFEFEVIVGDDGSKDGTLAAIRRVAAKFPQLRVIAQPKNIGVTENYLAVHGAARGEYVAHLDGDDFWLPGKLQAQVEVLDAHPECSVAWHPMIAFDERGMHYIIGDHGALVRRLLQKDSFELSDAILAYSIAGFHSACMYRRNARTLFQYSHPFLIDYRLTLSFLERGAGYHMRRPLGCYRAFHDQSATRGGTDFVGPGLLRTLAEYSASHPELRPRIASHCVAAVIRRTRFQTYLASLLVSRIVKERSHTATGARPIFHDNISLRRRLVGQWHYATNTARFVWFGVSQGVLPRLHETMVAVRVNTYQSRPHKAKGGFFERKYRPPPGIPVEAA